MFQVGIVLCHVGRVAQDEVETGLGGQGAAPVAPQKVNLSRIEAPAVLAGDFKGGSRAVGGVDLAVGAFMAHDDRNGAAACTKIGDIEAGSRGYPFQGLFHQQFGFGSGYQGVGSDAELKGPELPLAGDVGNGFALESSLQVLTVEGCLWSGYRFLWPGQQMCAVFLQTGCQQDLRVEISICGWRLGEQLSALSQ